MYKIIEKRLWVVVLISFLTFSIASCGNKEKESSNIESKPMTSKSELLSSSEKLKIGFITVGPISDSGFNYSINQGRFYLDSKLGDKVQTTIVENVPESADVERVMQNLIKSGSKLLFPTSFGYMEPGLRVAERNPNVIFMHTGGYKIAPNFGTFTSYLDEAFYLCGIVAGHITKSNKIGFVAAHPVPPIVREINAITLGARSINPKIEVIVIWTGGWSDPVKETEAANTLIDNGCDILCNHQDSPMAVVRAAESRGVYSIGTHADCSQFAPKGWLTGAEWNWGPFITKIVESVLNKTWKSEMLRGGIKEGYVKLSKYGSVVSTDIRNEVTNINDKILKGEMNIFSGPLKDVTGKIRIEMGKVPSFEELEGMNWFVDGVKGTLK